MLEVVKKPLEMRTSGASALLFCIMRGTSSNLHSRAKKVIRALLNKSMFTIGDGLSKGKFFVCLRWCLFACSDIMICGLSPLEHFLLTIIMSRGSKITKLKRSYPENQ